jgi:hypothetical protein
VHHDINAIINSPGYTLFNMCTVKSQKQNSMIVVQRVKAFILWALQFGNIAKLLSSGVVLIFTSNV